MEHSNSEKINEAVRQIKANNLELAKRLLTEVLNLDSNSDNAWFLLSFTLPSKERQIYALNQALKINPYNQNAIGLLNDLLGNTSVDGDGKKLKKVLKKNTNAELIEKRGFSAPTDNSKDVKLDKEFDKLRDLSNYDENNDKDAESPSYLENQDSEKLEKDSGDLLSARIPDTDNPTNVEEDLSLGEEDRFSEFRAEATIISHNKDNNASNKISQKRVKKLNKKLPKNRSRSNRRALLILLIVVFASGGYYLYVNGLLNYETGEKIIAYATELFLPTETPKPTETAIPPTLTVIPSITPINTKAPTSTPANTPIPIATFTAEPLKLDVQNKISLIQDQIDTILEIDTSSEGNLYFVSNQYIENVLINNFESTEFIENSKFESDLLEFIGINNKNYDMATHALNTWVEPRGGLYNPETRSIFFSGLNFDVVEQYIFVQEYTQYLIDEIYGILALEAYPHCLELGEICRAAQALIKGQALFVAKLWAEIYLSIEEQNTIAGLFPQIYFIQAGLPPDFSSLDLEFNSIYGKNFVSEIFLNGGISAINQIYKDPPTTTEQIIHPEKYIDGEEAIDIESISIHDIVGGNWRLIKTSELGEWRTYLLLAHGNEPSAQLEVSEALLASEGWGGDELQYFIDESSGEEIALINWIMDSEQDGLELANGLTAYLDNLGGAYSEFENGIQCWNGIKYSCIYINGTAVDYIISSNQEYPVLILNSQIIE